MKKYLFSLLFIAFSVIAACQENPGVHAMIAGYNIKDTIRLADFMKLTDLSVDNKDYPIVKFTFFYSDSGYDHEIVSNSAQITQEMKNGIAGIENRDKKFTYIVFRNIILQTPKHNKMKAGDLIYVLSLK